LIDSHLYLTGIKEHIMQILTEVAKEQGTYIVTGTFKDEDGAAVTPDSITWTLTDSSGTVINSRQDVSETPAASVEIVLSGDDLSILSGETASKVSRHVTFEAVVDTDAGSNLPVKDEAVFPLENLTAIT
jgi:hypothetical protein